MKNQTTSAQTENPLGTAPVGSLITKFAIPAIISMLVSALYNIVDQIFIGQGRRNAWKRRHKYRISRNHYLYCCCTAPGNRKCLQLQPGNGRGNRKKCQLHRRNRTFLADNLRYDTLCHRPSVPEATASFFSGGTPDVMPLCH